MNKRVKSLIVPILLTALPSGVYASGSDTDELNRAQLSAYTQECRNYVAKNEPIDPKYVDNKLRNLESYLGEEEPSIEKLNSIIDQRFIQTFQGIRGPSCPMLPPIIYDTIDGKYTDYRN